MVVCKYFQQGNCRFGQYCRFEHISGFGAVQGSGNKSYGDGKSIVLAVAEEVLAAERGGQWLLSCFGPFKEQPCIPGMEDVSPEEVRWEMYQAQKNGAVEQTKLQFQQLCQEMTAKREALKNPTHETAAMLDKLQKYQRDVNFGSKSNFALSSPQLSGTVPGTTAFGNKTFGSPSSGTFGEGFSQTSSAQTSIFGRTPVNTSVFGGKSSFGAFSAQQVSNSIFGDSAKPSPSVFGGGQSLSTFVSTPAVAVATAAPTTIQTTSSFGTVNHPNLFSTTQQQNSIFSTAQSLSIFGGPTTSTSSVFSNSQSTNSSTAVPFESGNLFGSNGSHQSAGSSIFGGGSVTPTNSNSNTTSVFGEAKTTAAFGGAPVFNRGGGLGGAAPVFASQATFANNGNIFGHSNANSTFGLTPQTPSIFAAPVVSSQKNFTNNQISTAYGTSVVTTSSSPFGISFASSEAAAPFTGGGTFGSVSTTFAPTTTIAAVANLFAAKLHEPTLAFGEPESPFRAQIPTAPFGQSSAAVREHNETIDNSIYSSDADVPDIDRGKYLAESFVLTKIPVNPPTIELR